MSAHPEMTPARGPSVAPTKPYTLPAWLKRWVSRTKVQAIKSTPMVASANASGTARPTPVSAVPCGLMLAAMEGAMSANEIPTASHRCNSRRRCGLSVALASAVTSPPSLGRNPFPRECPQYLTPRVNGLQRRAQGSRPWARRALQLVSTLSPSGLACQHVSKNKGADWLTSESRRLERADMRGLREGPPSTRFRGGDVAVEAEDVVWIVAVLEGDEAFPVLGGMGGSYPLGARAVELHEIDVGVAGLEGTRRFGHVG